MTHREAGLFDGEDKLGILSALGDNLEKLDKLIAWDDFRPLLVTAFTSDKSEPKGPGGRPPFDYVMRFKLLVLKRLYNLSADQAEYQINDRRTFMRFLGLREQDKVPDAKTIWLWEEQLTKAGAYDRLFERFTGMLETAHIETGKGIIVDATFVEVRKQRNNRDDNDKLKKGEVPEEWKKPGNETMLRQKDTDARWTKKNGVSWYGYKNHVLADAKTKLVSRYAVTDASVHDSQVVDELITEREWGKELHGDSAYAAKEIESKLRGKGIIPKITEKGYRNRPLTDSQKVLNREKSSVRSRIEHIFAFMTVSMRGLYVRTIGMVRAKAQIALTNLVYNMCRFVVLAGN